MVKLDVQSLPTERGNAVQNYKPFLRIPEVKKSVRREVTPGANSYAVTDLLVFL